MCRFRGRELADNGHGGVVPSQLQQSETRRSVCSALAHLTRLNSSRSHNMPAPSYRTNVSELLIGGEI